MKLLIVVLMLAFAAPAAALQGTYTCPLPADAARTGVKIQRRDGPDTATWVLKTATPIATCNFTEAGLALSTRYCYRAITTGALGDGDPNTESCVTADKPMSAGSGTLLITP